MGSLLNIPAIKAFIRQTIDFISLFDFDIIILPLSYITIKNKKKMRGGYPPLRNHYATIFPDLRLETTSKITATKSTPPFTTYCHESVIPIMDMLIFRGGGCENHKKIPPAYFSRRKYYRLLRVRIRITVSNIEHIIFAVIFIIRTRNFRGHSYVIVITVQNFFCFRH